MSASLVGSEMCIRDRQYCSPLLSPAGAQALSRQSFAEAARRVLKSGLFSCLLYTSALPTICSV
eukprot:10019127-Alexandrium_andersonii.AAC.1